MTTLPCPRLADHDELVLEIAHARYIQQQARAAWAHSPTTLRAAAAETATRELDVLLERLHAALTHSGPR